MGLLGGVLDDGHAICQGGGQHDVHGGPYRDHVQIHLAAGQTAAAGDLGADQAVAHVHVGPHGHKALDVLVDGPSAQVAAPGQGDLRPAKAAQQGPHQVIAGADLPGQVIGHLAVADVGAVHVHRILVHRLYVGTQLLKDLEDQRHVADLGDILNAAHPVHHQGGGDNGHSGILRAADLNGPVEGATPMDLILRQILHLPHAIQGSHMKKHGRAICKYPNFRRSSPPSGLGAQQGRINLIHYSIF